MNLNELIVLNKIEFPKGAYYATQDADGEISFWQDSKGMEFGVRNWDSSHSLMVGGDYVNVVADDYRIAIVQKQIPFLMEIVVNAFDEWPNGASVITQDYDGDLMSEGLSINHRQQLLCGCHRERCQAKRDIPKMGRVTKQQFLRAKELMKRGFVFNDGITKPDGTLITVWDDYDVIVGSSMQVRVCKDEPNVVMYAKYDPQLAAFARDVWKHGKPIQEPEELVDSEEPAPEEPVDSEEPASGTNHTFTVTEEQLNQLKFAISKLSDGNSKYSFMSGVILGTIESSQRN